jgi:hypothetical protein
MVRHPGSGGRQSSRHHKGDPCDIGVVAESPKVVAQIEAIMKREHEPAATEKFKFEALGEK